MGAGAPIFIRGYIGLRILKGFFIMIWFLIKFVLVLLWTPIWLFLLICIVALANPWKWLIEK